MPKYRTQPQPLGNVLEALIDALGIRERMEKARVVETWAELAGMQINSVTHSVWFNEGILFVRLHSAVWRHELNLRRNEWCRRLNEELEKEMVKEIVFK